MITAATGRASSPPPANARVVPSIEIASVSKVPRARSPHMAAPISGGKKLAANYQLLEQVLDEPALNERETLVALLNFAPYVGPLIGLLLMLLMGFISYDGAWPTAAWAPLVPAAITSS